MALVTDDVTFLRDWLLAYFPSQSCLAALDRVEDRLLEADSVLQTLDHLRERTEQAERERDEARDRIAANEQFTTAVWQGREELERERDEARREIERLTLPNITRDQLPSLYTQARAEADRLRKALRTIDWRLTTAAGDNVSTSHAAAILTRDIARAALAGPQAEEQT